MVVESNNVIGCTNTRHTSFTIAHRGTFRVNGADGTSLSAGASMRTKQAPRHTVYSVYYYNTVVRSLAADGEHSMVDSEPPAVQGVASEHLNDSLGIKSVCTLVRAFGRGHPFCRCCRKNEPLPQQYVPKKKRDRLSQH